MATYIEIQIKDYEREALVYSYLYYIRILSPDPSSQHSSIASSKSHHWALTCSLNTLSYEGYQLNIVSKGLDNGHIPK